MVSVDAVADYILAKVDRGEGDSITHLKLQKLIYYCQAWYLAFYDKPLFDEPIQAWAHGPVVPVLWHRFKHYGWQAIDPEKLATNPLAELDERARDMIDEVWATYGSLSGSELRRLTHKEPPWKDAYGDRAPGEACYEEIPRKAMAAYFKPRIPT